MSSPPEPWPSFLARHHGSILSELRRTNSLTRLIEELLPATERRRILEVGCGSAITSFALAESGYSTVCVDHDPAVLSWVDSRYPFFSRFVSFGAADMRALPFASASFDLAFSQGLLEHYADRDIVDALAEQERVARLVVFDVPNARHANQRLRGDERLLPIAHYRGLCERAGLEVLKLSGRRWLGVLGFLSEDLLRRRSWLSRFFAQSSIFVIRRSS